MANFIGLVYATLKEAGIDTSKMSTDEAVKKFEELQEKEKKVKEDPENIKRKLNGEKAINKDDLKEKQLEIINKNNPMVDDYHVGIRSIEDIKTFDEVINDEESFVWGDFSKEDAEKALNKGEITVYSSYPIKQGVFVSTSKNQAKDYAGGKEIYSATIPIDKVAWINGDEGQYADIEK